MPSDPAPPTSLDAPRLSLTASWLDTLRSCRHDADCLQGARDISGISLGVAAWGLVTGVAMVKSGLALHHAVLMSVFVFAGTAQLASLPLIAAGAPIWVVLATAACLNLRFVIFSAQWRRYFGGLPTWQRVAISYYAADINFAIFTKRYPDPQPAPGQVRYFWGGCLVNASAWHVASLAGIFLAHRIPMHWGLAFAGTAALLGMTLSLMKDGRTWFAALVSGAAALLAFDLPLRLNIVVAIVAAVTVGLVLDHHPWRPRAKPSILQNPDALASHELDPHE